MIKRPNSELVVCEWINTIPEIARTPNPCAMELPQDNSTWGASGFITVAVIGGSRDVYLNAGRPVVQIDTWAVHGSKPLWAKAHNIMSAIIDASFNGQATLRRTLSLATRKADYGTARVMECYPLGEPKRVPEDESEYAHVTMDMQFHWVGLTNGA